MPGTAQLAPPLAAKKETVSLKNRVRGSRGIASGQTTWSLCASGETATASAVCGDQTASGLAKWLSRDPIGEEGGLNLYGYVHDDPINRIDPLGLWEPLGTTPQEGGVYNGHAYGPGGVALNPSLPGSVCAQIKQEIAQEQQVLAAEQNMYNNIKSGQTFADYGMGESANSAGYRDSGFSNMSPVYQDTVNELEHDGVNNFFQGVGVVVGGSASAIANPSQADTAFLKARISQEMQRTTFVLARLQAMYNAYCKCNQ